MSKFLFLSVLIAFSVIESFDCHQSTGIRLKKRQIFYDLCTPNKCINGKNSWIINELLKDFLKKRYYF